MGPALCTPKQLLLPLYLSYLSPKLGTNGRSTDLKSLLRQFIQCCSGPPTDSRFVQPTTVYETPQAVSTCFDGSSSAVSKRNTHRATYLRNCVQQLVYIVGLRTLSVADCCRRQFWILSQFLLCAFFVCKQSRNRLATCLSP